MDKDGGLCPCPSVVHLGSSWESLTSPRAAVALGKSCGKAAVDLLCWSKVGFGSNFDMPRLCRPPQENSRPARGVGEGLSRMRGNLHVRFSGEGAAVMPLPYPTEKRCN